MKASSRQKIGIRDQVKQRHEVIQVGGHDPFGEALHSGGIDEGCHIVGFYDGLRLGGGIGAAEEAAHVDLPLGLRLFAEI